MTAGELIRALNGHWHGSYGTARYPAHGLASARVDAGSSPADADDIATMHAPELIGGDLTHHIPVLRQIWWQHRGLGYRYPAEPGIIVIKGGRR